MPEGGTPSSAECLASLKSSWRSAVEGAELIVYVAGLGAILRGEGKGKIRASDSRSILGSSNIDKDCLATYPNAHRWDYVVGYVLSKTMVAHFIEVHSAVSSQVSVMRRKLDWLEAYLNRDANRALGRIAREYHWVASGRFKIPKNSPQYRQLLLLRSRRGLKGPHKSLQLM
jgi:hypothetical protein